MSNSQRTEGIPGGTAGSRQGQRLQTDWESTLAQPHGFVWYTAVLISLCGVLSVATGLLFFLFLGLALLAIGGTTLALLAFATEFRLVYAAENRSLGRSAIIVASALVFILAVAVSSNVLTTPAALNERYVILSLGLQALFLTIDIRPSGAPRRSRAALLVLSHGIILTGSAVTLELVGGGVPVALLLYSVGFSVLSLHAFWSRQLRPGVTPPAPESRRRYWESLLLTMIILGTLSTVVVVFAVPRPGLLLRSGVGRVGTVLIGAAGVVELAILSVPESPPRLLRLLTTPRITICQHVLTLLVLANTLLLAPFLVAPMSFSAVLAGLLVLLSLGVTLNYLSVAYGLWRESDPPEDHTEPGVSDTVASRLTVVVSAANEADVLPETLSHNLAALPGAEFILVPAGHSTDGTRDIMHRAERAHPDRVRVVEGPANSKAGDLNAVWPRIDTPYALLLDADETVSPEAVELGCRTLAANPDIGIVQGRKAAAHPAVSALSRYVTVERQQSTWLDHPLMDDFLGAGHFAGSAAVVRRSVVPAVGGFDPDVLTEDIELSVRLYLETDWEIAYEPAMVVRELNPRSVRSLVRQRERWARGWAQVAFRYLGRIVGPGSGLRLRRAVGLTWELLTAVSSPVYTIFPALLVYWAFGPANPPLLLSSTFLALYLAIERGVSFSIAALCDPAIPQPPTPRAVGETLLFGYLWLLFGWVIQLHSLYLQSAGATESWDVTAKQSPRTASDGRRGRELLDGEDLS